MCPCHHLLVMQCKIKISHCDSFDAAFTNDPHFAFVRYACRLCLDQYLYVFCIRIYFLFSNFFFFFCSNRIMKFRFNKNAPAISIQTYVHVHVNAIKWFASMPRFPGDSNSNRLQERQSVFCHHCQFLIRKLDFMHVECALRPYILCPLLLCLFPRPLNSNMHLHATGMHPPHDVHMCRWMSNVGCLASVAWCTRQYRIHG